MMPLFGFDKVRLNPDKALAHGFLVVLGLDVAPGAIQHFLKRETLDYPSVAPGRT